VSPRSVGRTVLAHVWMPLVAVIAVGVGAVAMWKVHQFSEPPPVVTVNEPAAPPEFSIKRIDYEVFGSVGQGGTLVWVDYDGHPHTVDLASAPWPWTHHEETTLTVVSGSISAQVHGGQVGCRLRVNGVVRAEQSDTHQDAHVFCLVKSA
jgi:FtsP/CotA-like multicopper oxidase with cupredoxin domain